MGTAGSRETSRFIITDKILESDSFLLLRGLTRADDRPILLKAAGARRPRDHREVERMENELVIAGKLTPPLAARPIALDRYDGMPVLVLEDPGGNSLRALLGNPMPIGRFLRLASGITTALAELHANGIVHGDIKPESFLVDETTGRAALINFELASPLSREHRKAKNPVLIEGTLAYMSPEQTGRTGWAVDTRSDLYSLGVMFYEMLAGRRPFHASDPVEWVHCHIARFPPSIVEFRPEVPAALVAIVSKLLAKVAEERYQSAVGLRHDLDVCLKQWTEAARIDLFSLGERDAPDQFPIPQKLYGRDAEIAVLLSALERVFTTGAPELVFVSGPPGVGKSALVHELQKPVLLERGFFLSGKFDQYRRNIPYATIVQAFQGLALEILAEPDERLSAWRSALQAALGRNGQVIIEVIPQVEMIIGKQPPVPALPAIETQNRFHMAFQSFVGVCAHRDHPIALFLDDLQWADVSSLVLVQHLVRHPDTRYLLVVGAYRDTQVGQDHPVARMLEDMRRAGLALTQIGLDPLSVEHVNEIITVAARCTPAEAAPLAQLVHEKTAGNPLFAIQFLKMLDGERHLWFDRAAARWRWDIAEILGKSFTDNVVELMIAKLRRLPDATQEALTVLSCVGNTVPLGTLAMLLDRPEPDVERLVWEPVREGLLLRGEGVYRFAHDRVQQAAYSLIREERRPEIHLRIGRRLLARGEEEDEIHERIFDIVDQLNRGASLITDPPEKARLIALDFLAGKRARALVAYEPARSYLAQAAALLPPDAWATQYEDTFALYLERSECEYLACHFDAADALFDHILQHARSDVDRARVYTLRLRVYQVAGKYAEAIQMGLDALRLFGITFAETDARIDAEVDASMQEIQRLLGERRVADLVDAPLVNDLRVRAMLQLLADLEPAVYIGRPRLFPLIAVKSVECSLRYGNTEDSCFAYSAYGLMLAHLGDIPTAYEFSEMSLRLNEKLEDTRMRGTLLHLHGDHINFWVHHIATDFPILEQGFNACLEVGNLVYAGFLAFETVWQVVEKGDPLEEVLATSQRFAAFAKKSNNLVVYHTIRVEQQFVECLKGRTRGPICFDDAAFNETRCLEAITTASFGCGVVFFHIMKQIVALLLGYPRDALASAVEAQRTIGAAMAMPIEATHHFYHALTLTALYPDAPADEQAAFRKTLAGHLEKLDRWAHYCPENYFNRHALVSAELARLDGRDIDAMSLYEQAIQSARANGFVPNEGLAYELAAAFYRSRGFATFADVYLREARACYASWGADGKVAQIDRQSPGLVEVASGRTAATLHIPVDQLDLLSIMKASQSLSGEIVLDRLLCRLLQIMLEQGGAQRGCLLMAHGGELSIEAEAALDDKGMLQASLQSLPAVPSTLVPSSVVNYVRRTRERVLLHDGRASLGRFAGDPYFAERRSRSVVCLPIVKQANLIGLLYLENNLVEGAFTSERLAALELLATQAAISLESARLLVREQGARAAAEHAERQSALLADASRVLAESLDYEANLAQVLRMALPFFADWCVADLIHDHTAMREVAAAHADPSKEDLVRELRERYPLDWDSPHIGAHALRTNKAQLLSELTGESLRRFSRDDRHAALLGLLGARSAIAAPLAARGRVLGVITFVSAAPDRRYESADLAVAEELARRISVAIDNATLFRESREALEARDEFLSIASHELNTPLTSLRLTLQRLSRVSPERRMDPDVVRRLAAVANRSCQRLSRLVSGLLDVTHLQRGRLSIERTELDLVRLMREVVAGIEQDLASAGSSVSIDAGAPVVGRWDRSRLGQVISNLLSNALKFGAGKPIEIRIGERDGWAWFSVKDHGIGITPERSKHIFQRFERAVSVRHYGGLGLGLYVCHQIVEAHGGSIHVESEPQCGTTFIVELPCAPPGGA
ncbi:AAA family ATPase [Sorangium sp. So ce260]|uniref:sensor histidine kinase n=1 Tax=Sorangium sp. So ce260 TaxID=3133291 RepID=UPI003F5F8F3F